MLLKLYFSYTPRLSTAGSESKRYASESPEELHVWTTTAGNVRVLSTKSVSSGNQYVYSFELPASGTAEIYDGIAFNAYCNTYNSQAVHCISTAGTALLTFRSLVSGIVRAQDKSTKAIWILDLIDPTENDFVKGTLNLFMKKSELSTLSVQAYTFKKCSKHILKLSRSRAQAVLNKFCAETIEEVDSRFRPTAPTFITRPIRCPWDRQILLLPGSSYAAMRPKKPFSLAVYERLLDVALSRLRLSRTDVLKKLKTKQDFETNYRMFSLVVAHMFCALAWALPYIPDFVNCNRDDQPYRRSLVDDVSNENFKNILITLCGDCEDLAWLVYLLIAVFLESDYDDSLFSPLLRRLRKLLQQHYMYELSQCAVSVANGMDIRRGVRVDSRNITCHTFANLLPVAFVLHMLRRAKTKMTAGQQSGLLDELEKRVSTFGNQPSQLLPIGCEGTAPLPPLKIRHSAEEDNPELSLRNKALAALIERECEQLMSVPRRMETDPRRDVQPEDTADISDFYKSGVTCYTTYISHSTGYPCIDYCYLRNQGEALPATYGITAYDLFTEADSVELMPYNDYNTHRTGGIDLDVIKSILALLEPVPDLIVVDATASKMCERLQDLVDTSLHGTHDNSRQEIARVSYYLRSDQVNPSLLDCITEICARHELGVESRVTPLLATSLHPDKEIVCLDIDIIQYAE